MLVSGPAGIGKTRLVREVAAREGHQATFMLGGAVSIGGDDLPFAPIASALRRAEDWLRGRLPPSLDAVLQRQVERCRARCWMS